MSTKTIAPTPHADKKTGYQSEVDEMLRASKTGGSIVKSILKTAAAEGLEEWANDYLDEGINLKELPLVNQSGSVYTGEKKNGFSK